MQIKPADADRFLSRPDPAVRVILIYGSDEGLVAERVTQFAKAVAGDDPFARIRIESNAIADDPGRLADEANEVPLFGGTRVIVVNLAGPRPIQASVQAVLDRPPVDAWIVMAAGELRKSSPLRRLCETHKGAAAVACYADTGRDLDRIIDDETAAAGLKIDAEARATLKTLLGADRMVSRSEILKLCLYAADDGTITLDHVRAVIGDAAAFAMDEVVDAAAGGDAGALDRGYRRLLTAGTPGSVIVGAAVRHFSFLQKARAAYDDGASTSDIVARAAPPVFFTRRERVARQIGGWSATAIDNALARLDRALYESRLYRTIEDEVVGQALHAIAVIAPRGRR